MNNTYTHWRDKDLMRPPPEREREEAVETVGEKEFCKECGYINWKCQCDTEPTKEELKRESEEYDKSTDDFVFRAFGLERPNEQPQND